MPFDTYSAFVILRQMPAMVELPTTLSQSGFSYNHFTCFHDHFPGTWLYLKAGDSTSRGLSKGQMQVGDKWGCLIRVVWITIVIITMIIIVIILLLLWYIGFLLHLPRNLRLLYIDKNKHRMGLGLQQIALSNMLSVQVLHKLQIKGLRSRRPCWARAYLTFGYSILVFLCE